MVHFKKFEIFPHFTQIWGKNGRKSMKNNKDHDITSVCQRLIREQQVIYLNHSLLVPFMKKCIQMNKISSICLFLPEHECLHVRPQKHGQTDRHSWGYGGQERGTIWCQQMEWWREGGRRGEAWNQDDKTKCLSAVLKALISLYIPSAPARSPYAGL